MNGTATMTNYDQRARDLMAEIARIAPKVRSHKLATWMVDGSKPLSYPQANMVLMHLRAQLPTMTRTPAPESRPTEQKPSRCFP